MPFDFPPGFLLAISSDAVQDLMETAFYPTLLGILILASLGLPIPEDVPLIAAGVILKESPNVGKWHWTIIIALIGIMAGDLVLYTLGKRLGPNVVRNRWVRRIVTEEQFQRRSAQFHEYGAWFCFFGRFFMGVRAIMCIMAGATRFPYWKFFLADFAGALLSVPLFIVLGFLFANVVETLEHNVSKVQGYLVVGVALVLIPFIMHRIFKKRMKKKHVPADYVVDLALPPEPKTKRGETIRDESRKDDENNDSNNLPTTRGIESLGGRNPGSGGKPSGAAS